MNSIKVVSIVTLIVFCFMYFVTNKKLRTDILEVFDCNIGKKVKVKSIFGIFIIFIIIMYSFISLLDVKENIQDLISEIKDEDGIPLLKKERFTENNSIYFNCYEQDDYEEFIKGNTLILCADRLECSEEQDNLGFRTIIYK